MGLSLDASMMQAASKVSGRLMYVSSGPTLLFNSSRSFACSAGFCANRITFHATALVVTSRLAYKDSSKV